MVTSYQNFLQADENWRKDAKGIKETGELNPE